MSTKGSFSLMTGNPNPWPSSFSRPYNRPHGHHPPPTRTHGPCYRGRQNDRSSRQPRQVNNFHRRRASGPTRGQHLSNMEPLDRDVPSNADHNSEPPEMRTPVKQTLSEISTPPTLRSPHLHPKSPYSTPTETPTKPREEKKFPDIWHTRYLLEQRLLHSSSNTKPAAISFFTDTQTKITRESPHHTRKHTRTYTTDQIFGTAPERKAHLRPLEVTLDQIWNRECLKVKWERQKMDHQGYLELEEKEMSVQLQRHHTPGWFFVCAEGGSLDINDPSGVFPDVYYQIVDKPNQEFVRCGNDYDLRKEVAVSDDETLVSFKSVDGDIIEVDLEAGELQVRIAGKGMSRDYEGVSRGDLILDIVKKS